MSGAGGPRPYSPHGDRSDLTARYASGGDHLPVSMPTWASDRHDGASSSATIRLARLNPAMPDGRLGGPRYRWAPTDRSGTLSLSKMVSGPETIL